MTELVLNPDVQTVVQYVLDTIQERDLRIIVVLGKPHPGSFTVH